MYCKELAIKLQRRTKKSHFSVTNDMQEEVFMEKVDTVFDLITVYDPITVFDLITVFNQITVFDLITAHTPIRAQSSDFVVLRLQAVYFFVYFFIKAQNVGTHLNCIDLSMQFK